ncbi:hypothetical protein GGI03_008909, partial [Coemansia sp. RSA 2337]
LLRRIRIKLYESVASPSVSDSRSSHEPSKLTRDEHRVEYAAGDKHFVPGNGIDDAAGRKHMCSGAVVVAGDGGIAGKPVLYRLLLLAALLSDMRGRLLLLFVMI